MAERFDNPPSGDALQRLIRAFADDPQTPRTVRNATHQLMLAIETNDPRLIAQSLRRLDAAAVLAGVALPGLRDPAA